jgi:DNA-binding transcriptional LysR family regulator
MDLNLLKAFDALMSERNVTRAGDKIGLTQPAMSQALAKLRLEFNDELFVRTSRGMEPTSRAHEIFVEVSAALAHIKNALSQAEIFSPGTTQRTFVAGVAEYAEIALVEGIIDAFKSCAPGADVRLVPISKSDFVSQLNAQDIDVAIGHLKDVPSHIDSRTLYTEKLVAVAQKNHPKLSQQHILELPEYLSMTHILVSPTGEKRGAVDKELESRGLRRRIGLVVATFLALPLALRRSDYIASVPERTGQRLASLTDIQVLELPFSHVVEVDMVWHKRESNDAAQQWFRSKLMEVASNGGRADDRGAGGSCPLA